MLHRSMRLLAAAVLALGMGACGGSSGPDFVWLRAVHAIPDAPTIRLGFENYVYRREATFGVATSEGFESLLSSFGSTTRLNAAPLLPGGAVGPPLFDAEVPVETDSTSTVILAGQYDDPQLITVVSPRLQRPLAALHVQFVHAALAFGNLDVYVTAPDTALAATAPLTTLAPRAHTTVLEVPFGLTRIRVTPAGSLEPLWDSGEQDFRETDSATGPGMQWLFTISPSVIPGPSPLMLVGSTGRESFRFLDAGTPTTVRAVHAMRGVAAVDVVAATEPAEVVYTGLTYLERSPMVPAPVGEYPLEFRLSGEDGETLASATENYLQGQEVLALLVGRPDQASVSRSQSSLRSIATEARLRFTNVAPDSKFFSIYLTANADDELRQANILARDLRFGVIAGHLVRAPGEYFLTFTERFFEDQADAADAEETVVFGPMPIELFGGDVFTWTIFPPENDGEPEVLVQFDDRLP